MRIAINGTGIAGPTLAWWLAHYGHDPVLFEKAPQLRTGGYVIDFWGAGYDVAEKMGLAPALHAAGYKITTLRMVNGRGRTVATLDANNLRSMLRDRFVSIARGDVAAIIYRACDGAETHFGESIAALEESADHVIVRTDRGREERFDLVVGADGIHSSVRPLIFGRPPRLERHLGYQVAAFEISGYRPRDELEYVSHTAPCRQVTRVSLREDRTLFLFIYRSDSPAPVPTSGVDPREFLRAKFGDLTWEVPHILAQMAQASDIYFDNVSQIHLDHWGRGRVALVGDAAAAVSFLAGEGTGLAMVAAYVLAGELHKSPGEPAVAIQRYETALRHLLDRKQAAALKFAAFFAPPTAVQLGLRNLAIKATSIPFLARRFVGSMLRDEFSLPAYEP